MAARSSLVQRAFRHASSVVAALAALAPRLVRLAHHGCSGSLLVARPVRAPAAFIFGTAVALLSAAVPVLALNFFELEGYPASTEGQGLHEVENLTTLVANGRRPNEEEANGEEARRHRRLRTTVECN